MKKLCFLGITIFIVFFFELSVVRADVLSEFANWMDKMEALGDKVAKVESDLDSINETIKSLDDKERMITKLMDKIDKLENSEGTAQTMGVLKEGLADLRKVVEDQQVITAVLEKKYQSAQRPLEPIKQSLEEQSKAIATFVARFDEQDKKIKAMSDNIETKLIPLEEVTRDFAKKMGEIAKLSQMISDIEKSGGSLQSAVVANAGVKATSKEGEAITPGEEKKEGKKKFSIADALKAQGYEDVGGNFYVKGVNFKSFGSSVEVSGNIMNVTDRDYAVANFRIFVYDKWDKFIRSQDFSLKGLKKGNAEPFKEIISGVRLSSVGKYAMAYGKDVQTYQVTNLKELPKAQTIAKAGTSTDYKKTVAKQEDILAELEKQGYKDVGKNFFVRNLSLKKFGSSCEVIGELRNMSEKYISIAAFKIFIYDGKKKLIWKQDFSVKGIKGNGSKNFSEFLTGVDQSIIKTYEVKAK